MDATAYIPILARIEGELIWVIIVLVIMALSWIGRKIQEKNQQQQAEREYQRRRAEREGQRAQQRRGVPPPARPAPPPPVRTRPVGVAPAGERAHRRVRPPARPQPQPQPTVGTLENRHLRVSVEEEVRRQQQRLAADASSQMRRLAAHRPFEADTALVEARLVGVRPSRPGQAAPRKAPALLDLSEPDRLRLAIIYHEVFSAPRALRAEPEIWQ